VKDFYPERELIACLELHTYSSLSKNYLPLYSDSMKGAQKAIIYFNPEKVKAKKMEPLVEADIKKAFSSSNVIVTDDPEKLTHFLTEQSWKNKNLLMMSSGNFGGINLSQLVSKLGLG
jgi:UDP-N-acetylmuramate: L-alanyl-gamma-D-glutamyl-meso-diaminopimelate ligase